MGLAVRPALVVAFAPAIRAATLWKGKPISEPVTRLELPPGLLARFEPLDLLGTGSFSQVYRVIRREDSRHFALKLIPVRGDGRREQREVQLAIEVQHPFVIHTLEGGTEGDFAYLVQEVADGTLEERIRRRSQLPENWQALCEAAAGLWGLHQEGLIHRDLKPSNVMLTKDGAKLGDLGLAKNTQAERLTRGGMILGTPAYMAPEQARGEELTPAVDIFALAVMFYEALEGRLPYPEMNAMMLVIEVGKGNLRPFEIAEDHLDSQCLDKLRAALSADPNERPESLFELAEFPPGRLPSGDFPIPPPHPTLGPVTNSTGTSAGGAPLGSPLPNPTLITPAAAPLPAGSVTAKSTPLVLSDPPPIRAALAVPVPAKDRYGMGARRKRGAFESPWWARAATRALEFLVVGLLLAVAFRALR